jgi:uncharacterized protein YebE (UPF0316 family)
MNMNLLLIFVALSIVNVVFSTIKSIVTIKSGPWVASIVSALYYGYYNIVLIYTVADFPLWQKVVVTAGCNLVGVFIVKYGEEKARKDKLWKVELTVPTEYKNAVDFDLRTVPHSYIELSDKHTLFNFYCATQADSAKVKAIANQYEAKYFVAESKNL